MRFTSAHSPSVGYRHHRGTSRLTDGRHPCRRDWPPERGRPCAQQPPTRALQRAIRQATTDSQAQTRRHHTASTVPKLGRSVRERRRPVGCRSKRWLPNQPNVGAARRAAPAGSKAGSHLNGTGGRNQCSATTVDFVGDNERTLSWLPGGFPPGPCGADRCQGLLRGTSVAFGHRKTNKAVGFPARYRHSLSGTTPCSCLHMTRRSSTDATVRLGASCWAAGRSVARHRRGTDRPSPPVPHSPHPADSAHKRILRSPQEIPQALSEGRSRSWCCCIPPSQRAGASAARLSAPATLGYPTCCRLARSTRSQ